MSETISRHDRKANEARAAHEAHASHEAPKAAAIVETSTLEVAGLSVELPVKFLPGQVLDENDAKVIQNAYERQFANNQNANAKARVDALVKLGDKATDADRAKYAPLSAEALLALWVDYHPTPGGAPRQSSMERMKYEALWRAWVGLATDHNEAVKAWIALADASAPFASPITNAKAGLVTIQTAPRKEKGASDEAHKLALESFAQAKTAFLDKFATKAEYAARVQRELDALVAENEAKKASAKADDTAPKVEADSLFD